MKHSVRPLSILLLALLSGGCTFNTRTFPDGFSARTTGLYWYAPMPYGEGGVHYDFIGIGWLAHRESEDDLHLLYQGQEIAVSANEGRNGWRLTLAGQEKIKKNGWSLPSEREGWGIATEGHYPPVLVGCARRCEPPAVRQPASAPMAIAPRQRQRTDSDDQSGYGDGREQNLEPLRALDPGWDSVVVLLEAVTCRYVRILGFDSSRHEFVGSSVPFSKDYQENGIPVRFTLRERKTGSLLHGEYRHNDPRDPEGFVFVTDEHNRLE